MLTIAICDDEDKILPKLKEQIEGFLLKQAIQAKFLLYDCCEALFAQYDDANIDFLFLDIDMPNMTGFQLAQRLEEKDHKALLVFVTNQDALVYQSFSFHPFAFIRKAYFEQEIEEVLSRMMSEYKKIPEIYTFHVGSEIVKLELSNMLYFEADGNYVKLVAKKGQYRIRETLGNLTDSLEAAGFIRVHKGFLINQLYIAAIKQNEIELEDGALIPISRTNRDIVRRKLMQYLR